MDTTLTETIDWLSNKLREHIQTSEDILDIDKDFSEYGLDSLNAVSLVGEIEQWIGIELSATTLWDYTTIRQLAEYVQNLSNNQ